MLIRSAATELLRQLVTLSSPSGLETEAAAYLIDWLAAFGFKAYVDEVGNAVGQRGDGARHILLLGHIDTFPGTLPVRQEGNWLTGRGTVDAKGALAAFAVAATMAELAPDWRITVVGAVQEESATSLGARHILKHWPAPDYCVIGEPSSWQRITLGYKGRLLADLHWVAPFVHSAGQARLPAEQAVDLWNHIVAHCDAFNDGRTAAFERLEPSLRHIATRDQGAYAAVDMSLAFRLPLDLAPETLGQRLQAICSQAGVCQTPDDDASGLALTISGAEVAFRANKNTPLVRAFLAAIRQQGGQARFVLKSGTSDMNVVGPAWQIPIVAYGPGDSALDHTPYERINLDEYWQAILVLQSVLNILQRGDI